MADITKIQPFGTSTQYELGARYLTTGRTISISDNDATNTGPASSAFNGTANLTVKLPSTIKASLTGNASTATKATQDSDGKQINTTYAKLATTNNFVHSGNEWTVVPSGYSGTLYLNYRTCGGTNGNITQYNFGNGKGGILASITNGQFSGNAATATKLSNTPNNTSTFLRGDNTWSNTISGGLLAITNNSNTVTIGSANSSFCHFQNSANIPFYFNHYLRAVDSIGVYNTNTYMSANVVHCANGNPDGNSMGHGIELRHDGEGGNITFYSGNCGSYGSYQWEIDAYNGNLRFYNFNSAGTYHGSVYIGKDDGVLHGACWNDYAEFRETCREAKPGQCVIENGDDTLSLSTKRCQPGAQIVSDTYGFAIGEVEGKYETPLAVSGRVLAYTDVDRYKFKPGQAVCSGKNGTISRMRWYEKILWPERIIGFVSAIPDYEEWGNINAEVKVNNRIWIKVR